MAKGLSVHVGLNALDAAQYGGFDGILNGCEADANDMYALAESKGYKPKLILTKDATAANVTAAIEDVAKALASGDIFFLSYSGHGGQVPDTNGDEIDGLDETWALYDRQLIDDELYALWAKFKPGVRILLLSDSCHSGTVSRAMEFEVITSIPRLVTPYTDDTIKGSRALPPKVAMDDFEARKAMYEKIQRGLPEGDAVNVGASVLLISGCKDEQLSSDGARNGLFTETLLKVWHKGGFKGSYLLFYDKLKKRMPGWQQPNLSMVGTQNDAYEKESPFSI